MYVGGNRRWVPLGLGSVFVGFFKIIHAEPLLPLPPHPNAQRKLNGTYPKAQWPTQSTARFDSLYSSRKLNLIEIHQYVYPAKP